MLEHEHWTYPQRNLHSWAANIRVDTDPGLSGLLAFSVEIIRTTKINEI